MRINFFERFLFQRRAFYQLNGILNESTFVKEYEKIEPENDEVDYILDKVIRDCRNNFFHTIEYRCVYDFKITNISNNDEVILTISHDYMNCKPEYYGLNK